jgi:Helix-turn-helix domain of resolvase
MRGRPSYLPTEEDRNRIKLLLALGKSIPIMADAIGVSPATVKRYFRDELKVRDAMRHRVVTRDRCARFARNISCDEKAVEVSTPCPPWSWLN